MWFSKRLVTRVVAHAVNTLNIFGPVTKAVLENPRFLALMAAMQKFEQHRPTEEYAKINS